MPKKENSRRDFLQKGSVAAAGFFIVPRHVLGKGYTAPSDKLNIAAIGGGGKGSSDINNAYNNGANNIVAVSDVDWNSAKGTFTKFPNAKKYRDFRVMLDEMGKSIDAVTISTPDHFHAFAAMACMQLNKHVYVQKPMTHNIAEARLLTQTARKYNVVTQNGKPRCIKSCTESCHGVVRQRIDWNCTYREYLDEQTSMATRNPCTNRQACIARIDVCR